MAKSAIAQYWPTPWFVNEYPMIRRILILRYLLPVAMLLLVNVDKRYAMTYLDSHWARHHRIVEYSYGWPLVFLSIRTDTYEASRMNPTASLPENSTTRTWDLRSGAWNLVVLLGAGLASWRHHRVRREHQMFTKQFTLGTLFRLTALSAVLVVLSHFYLAIRSAPSHLAWLPYGLGGPVRDTMLLASVSICLWWALSPRILFHKEERLPCGN